MIHWFDTADYVDNINYYMLNISHNLGINMSKILIILIENMFKSYGAKFKSQFSQRSIFFKIFKDPNKRIEI